MKLSATVTHVLLPANLLTKHEMAQSSLLDGVEYDASLALRSKVLSLYSLDTNTDAVSCCLPQLHQDLSGKNVVGVRARPFGEEEKPISSQMLQLAVYRAVSLFLHTSMCGTSVSTSSGGATCTHLYMDLRFEDASSRLRVVSASVFSRTA